MTQMFYDCPQCGDIGLIGSLQDHPLRSCPCDLGFCPKCGGEIQEFLNEPTIREVITSYDEDPDEFLAKLNPTPDGMQDTASIHPLAAMVALDEEIEAESPGWMTGRPDDAREKS